MDNKTINLLSKSLWVALSLFAIRFLLCRFTSIYNFFGAAGEVVSLTTILMLLYCRFLWKYNPLEKTPKLMGTYRGTIEYCFNGAAENKNTTVIIKQTLLSIKISINTNEIISNTIIGNLVKENDENVLYYTYITNPKSKYSKENPIQYGTCRLLINRENYLYGTYWTSRQTIGDKKIKKVKE